MSLLEKWKIVLDRKGYAGAILMDLCKTIDTLNHDLLIAKLHSYGFSDKSLKFIKSYLTNSWQITKVNISFSSWYELLLGVPQGSFLGPQESTNVCNNANDTTFHACDSDLGSLINRMEHDSMLAIEWFETIFLIWI